MDEALIVRACSAGDVESADRRPDAAQPLLPLARVPRFAAGARRKLIGEALAMRTETVPHPGSLAIEAAVARRTDAVRRNEAPAPRTDDGRETGAALRAGDS